MAKVLAPAVCENLIHLSIMYTLTRVPNQDLQKMEINVPEMLRQLQFYTLAADLFAINSETE